MSDDLVRRWDVFVYLTEYYNHRTELQHDCLKQALSRVPSAEPERKTGKWEVHNILDYEQRPTGRKVGRGPFCGRLTGDFRTVIESNRELTNLCPNCGAEMGGTT